jgi:hypothetical protein
MDALTLSVEVFGVASLALAFAKYTLDKRKAIDADSNMKNSALIGTA